MEEGEGVQPHAMKVKSRENISEDSNWYSDQSSMQERESQDTEIMKMVWIITRRKEKVNCHSLDLADVETVLHLMSDSSTA